MRPFEAMRRDALLSARDAPTQEGPSGNGETGQPPSPSLHDDPLRAILARGDDFLNERLRAHSALPLLGGLPIGGIKSAQSFIGASPHIAFSLIGDDPEPFLCEQRSFVALRLLTAFGLPLGIHNGTAALLLPNGNIPVARIIAAARPDEVVIFARGSHDLSATALAVAPCGHAPDTPSNPSRHGRDEAIQAAVQIFAENPYPNALIFHRATAGTLRWPREVARGQTRGTAEYRQALIDFFGLIPAVRRAERYDIE